MAGADSEHGIIVLGEPKATQKDYDELSKTYKLKHIVGSREEIIKGIKEAAAEGGYDSVLCAFGASQGAINEELLGPLKGKLKFCSGIGAGYDTVDTKWLESVGAWYCNTPISVSDTTATTAVTLIMMCLRNVSALMATVKRGEWRKGAELTPDARGFVVGILGMGTIGKLVRNKVQALGMKVIYSNRKPLPKEEEGGATYVTFEELLKQAQLITVHTPLNPATRHLLSTKEFEAMQDGVMIVNTSRGPVIDEKALVEALKSGKIGRVGLDVFEEEPKIQPYLMECDRAALLPHFGSATVRLPVDTELEVISNFKDWVETGNPTNGVNNPLKST